MDNLITGTINKDGFPITKCRLFNSRKNLEIDLEIVIDTGAYDFFIKKSVAELIELQPIGNAKILHPVDGEIPTEIYLADIGIGNCKFNSLPFKVLHIGNYPVDVIIGTLFLKGKSFAYDGSSGIWNISW